MLSLGMAVQTSAKGWSSEARIQARFQTLLPDSCPTHPSFGRTALWSTSELWGEPRAARHPRTTEVKSSAVRVGPITQGRALRRGGHVATRFFWNPGSWRAWGHVGGTTPRPPG